MELSHSKSSSYHILLLGVGCLGRGLVPLLVKHIPNCQITIITKKDCEDTASELWKTFPTHIHDVIILEITVMNLLATLYKYCGPAGSFLVNATYGIKSVDVIKWCRDNNILYLDTSVEPWDGLYIDPSKSASERSNYELREEVMLLRASGKPPTTAIIAHGANPGLISHFVKQGLLDIAAKFLDQPVTVPSCQKEWALLAEKVGLKVIHVSEKDTQVASTVKPPNEFRNTWSVEGLIGESRQPAELGWGTHEKSWPKTARFHAKPDAPAIYLNRPACSVKVRTWAPKAKAFHGFLITHHEAISLADFLTVRDEYGFTYRPTVHYAYHPCNDTILSLNEFNGCEYQPHPVQTVMLNEIVDGIDELGALLMGTFEGQHYAYWYGSQLDIHKARAHAPFNSATSLQAVSSMMAAILWAIDNPKQGIVEAEDIPHDVILTFCAPYVAPVIGSFTDWTPVHHRDALYNEDMDLQDPWQFHNILVQ